MAATFARRFNRIRVLIWVCLLSAVTLLALLLVQSPKTLWCALPPPLQDATCTRTHPTAEQLPMLHCSMHCLRLQPPIGQRIVTNSHTASAPCMQARFPSGASTACPQVSRCIAAVRARRLTPCILRRIMYVMQFLQFSLASFYDPVRGRQLPATWYAVVEASPDVCSPACWQALMGVQPAAQRFTIRKTGL